MNNDMRNQGDIPTVRIPQEGEGSFQKVKMGISSIIGTRKSQQDTVFGKVTPDGAIAIVCDGMGGLEGGEIASKVAAETLARDYFDTWPIAHVPSFFREEALKMDQAVFELTGENGLPLEAGTTIVSVIVQNNGLYWLSVGDSRIYLIRNNEIVTVNQEHNYRMTLNAQLKDGIISRETYEKEDKKGDALISFLGMGNVSLMDLNQAPFLLEPGDMVLLCSDGLYRSLDEEKLLWTIRTNMPDIQRAAHCLTACAMDETESSLDNTSLVLLQYME